MNLIKLESVIENINTKSLIQVLKEIKLVKDAFNSIEISVKSNFSKIKFTKQLKYENLAFLEMSLIEGSWIIEAHNFPEKCTLLKIGTSINLKSAAETFLLTINNLQNYYESLYILDINCIVLEPVDKLPSINWRLIKYSKFAFLKIEFVDPFDANNFEVTFYGKDHIIKELSATYKTHSEDSNEDDETDIYQKLCIKLNILEFPYKKSEITECSICFSNELNPIICCENPKCDQIFHPKCLRMYLNVKSYKILSVAVGECPCCKHKISSNFAGFIEQNNELRMDDG